MSAKKIWDTLSVIDVNEHTDKKGRFTYLSWTWAWATMMENFPDTEYEMSTHFMSNGTAEVRCSMVVTSDGEQVRRNMWLAVTDFNNKAIPNPDSMDINTAKMRCLVKCLCMYGLGHYIYAGESFPTEEK